MELKHSVIDTNRTIRRVIIEPYWNWNDGTSLANGARVRYNWTLLELKQRSDTLPPLNLACYNWTLLELKHEFYTDECRLTECYNWTLLELKLIDNRSTFANIAVIIEPYWNWNMIAEKLGLKERTLVIIEPYWNWNASI